MTNAGFVSRRRFLGEVGAGMLFASLGADVLRGLGLPPLLLDGDDDRLDFGPLEPLVRLMQDTPADKIVAACIEKLKSGTPLDTLVAAAALANARTFGGEDYTGYHCEMALMPARLMASRMPDKRLAALPVLKVIHRNTAHMQEKGGHEKEVLRRAPAGTNTKESLDGGPLLAAERKGDVAAAEAAFANLFASAPGWPEGHIDTMQPLVRDTLDVHQVVLAWRAYDLISVAGKEHAQTLLRQSIRHCVANEGRRVRDGGAVPAIRDLLPSLIEENRLKFGPGGGGKEPSDTELDALARTIFAGTREEAARAAAPAIQSITSPAVAEAISLAAIRLVLHDPGQTKESTGKPVGSVHGASVGVHASDAAHAWKCLAWRSFCPTIAANLITAAWHTAGQSGHMDKEKPMHASARDRAAAVDAKDLPGAIDESIRGRDQLAAAALVERWGMLGIEPQPLVEKLLGYAVEADGALHHEKFFATTIEAFTDPKSRHDLPQDMKARPKFRFEYLAGLARVLASGYGFEAPGLKEARERLLA